MNSKRPLSEIQPCSSPRSSARLSSKKTKLELESDTIDIPNTYRKIERLLSNGLFALISLLQQIGLLNKSMRCQDYPRVEMVLCEHQKPIDGWWWKCSNLSCRRRYSIRQNSFFSRSHLSIDKLFVLAFAWFRGDSQRNAALEAEIQYVTQNRGEGRGGNKTISDWFNYCRDVCREILHRKSEMIGGYGKIVELDESAFGKRKYNRGRRRKTQWVFGGIERESNKMFAVTVKSRKRRTLWPIIFKYVKPGTVILTDGWRSYMGLEGRNDYHHYTVNHTENFKDPNTGTHINWIEGSWLHLKRHLHRHGARRNMMANHFSSFLWKRAYGNENFGLWLSHAANIYNPNQPQNYRVLQRPQNIEEVGFEENLREEEEEDEEEEEETEEISECIDLVNQEQVELEELSDGDEEDENEEENSETDSEED